MCRPATESDEFDLLRLARFKARFSLNVPSPWFTALSSVVLTFRHGMHLVIV